MQYVESENYCLLISFVLSRHMATPRCTAMQYVAVCWSRPKQTLWFCHSTKAYSLVCEYDQLEAIRQQWNICRCRHVKLQLFHHPLLHGEFFCSLSFFRFKAIISCQVSVLGEEFHWQLTGANSVSRATATSLRVTVLHPNMKGRLSNCKKCENNNDLLTTGLTLLRAAKQYNWRVNWIGEPGKNGGITMPRTSGWRQDTGIHLNLVLLSHNVFCCRGQ